MKTSYIKIFAVVCTLGVALMASAQAPHSAYFLEGMVQRHELNAAFGGESNYVAIPGIAGLQAGVSSNFGLANFVFQRNDGLVTGLSSQVSADEFIGGMPANNRLEILADIPVVSVGFRALGGFNTIVIKERSFVSANVPSTLFEFLKVGDNTSIPSAQYNIENLSLYTNNYVELALGHSRKLPALEGFSYGAKVKLLAGLFAAEMNMKNIAIDFSAEKWMVEAQGESFLSSGMQYTYDENGVVSGIGIDKFRLGGFGFGVDLGAVYTPAALPELTVSLALNYIGFISWSQVNRAVSEGSYEFTGFDLSEDESAPIDEQLEELSDDVLDMLNLREAAPENHLRSLQTTLNVAAEYAILQRKISFGILSSTRFGAPYTYAEGMAVVNFRPCDWFQASINGSISNLGGALGALINFCPNGINIFAGCDYISPNMKFSEEGIPLYGMRLNLRAGIIVAFGKK